MFTIFGASTAGADARSASASCADEKNLLTYQASVTRGTGTISIRDGRPLCNDAELVLESFNVPDTWDGNGWNKTAIPQTKYASTTFTIPAGVSNFKETYEVETPHQCKNTQVDFYLAPEYESITTMTGDDERNIVGVLFPGKGECEEPKPEPKPEPEKIVCKSIQLVTDKEEKLVRVAVEGAAENTAIKGYRIDFGDGTVINEQTAEHTYADYGKYTINAYVVGLVDDKEATVTSDDCSGDVEFIEEEPATPPATPEPEPEQPEEVEEPEVLPNTGVGSIAAIFSAATIFGTVIHYIRGRFIQ